MRFLSLCSGIEAASVAWHPLGWQAAAFSEIEPFPSAVLAHHWPDVPNLGDMTQYEQWPDLGTIDLMAGGTPCQAFSVAGQRAGLSDDRGNLTLTYCDIADRIAPEWCLWENVPGVLSMQDNAFGCFLGRLCGEAAAVTPPGGGHKWGEFGMVSGPARTIAWRVLDAQYFGLAQRRRRVFVLAVRGARNWRAAAALFPLGDGLQWHPAQGRAQREGVAAALAASTGKRGGVPSGNTTEWQLIPMIAGCLQARDAKGQDSDTKPGHLIPVAFARTQITSPGNVSVPRAGDPCHPLAAAASAPVIAFSGRERGDDGRGYERPPQVFGEVCGAIETVKPHCVAYGFQPQQGGANPANGAVELVPSLQSGVRRLTPVECERLQGFPDGHTAIPWRGKPAALCPDSPRYRALGNSMAVPVMRWIGARIEFVKANY